MLREQICFQDANFVSSTFVGWEKSLGNIEKTLTLNASRLFLRLCTQAMYFEEAEFASQKQIMFCFLSVCSPMQHCEQHRLGTFLHQCFGICAGLKTADILQPVSLISVKVHVHQSQSGDSRIMQFSNFRSMQLGYLKSTFVICGKIILAMLTVAGDVLSYIVRLFYWYTNH